mgnify:CR=1 FL=1
MKIVSFIKDSSRLLLDGFKRFPITYILIAILAVALEININNRLSKVYFEGGLFYGIFVSVLATLIIERKVRKNAYLQAIPVVLGVVSSIVMWQLLKHYFSYNDYFIMAFYIGTMIAMFSMCVWLLCKKENIDTIYMELLWADSYSVLSILVLFLGVMVCLIAFDSLIMPIEERPYSIVAVYSWIGLVPMMILSRIPREDNLVQRPKLYVKFFTFLAIPCVLLLAILCIYVGKIILTLDMPSNRLNIFASICILVYLFMYAAIKGNSSKPLSFLLRWCWIPIIPIVIAQITGIIIRYNAYGLTPLRMAGMVTLAIGIYGLYITARNKSLKSIWLVIAVAAIVFSISPLNIIDISVKNQNDRVEKILVKNSLLQEGKLVIPEKLELSDEDEKIIKGSWKLLRYYCGDPSSKVLIDYFDVNKAVLSYSKDKNNGVTDLLTILNIDNIYVSVNTEIYCVSSYGDESKPLPCSGYSYIRFYDSWKRSDADKQEFFYKDGKYFIKLESNARNDSEFVEYDVTKFVDKLLESISEENDSQTDTAKVSYSYHPLYTVISDSDALWEISDNIALVVKSLYILDPPTIKIDAGRKHSLTFRGYIFYK